MWEISIAARPESEWPEGVEAVGVSKPSDDRASLSFIVTAETQADAAELVATMLEGVATFQQSFQPDLIISPKFQQISEADAVALYKESL